MLGPVQTYVVSGFANRLKAMVSGICCAREAQRQALCIWNPELGICGAFYLDYFDMSQFPKNSTISSSMGSPPNLALLRNCNTPQEWQQIISGQSSGDIPIIIKSYGAFYGGPKEVWLATLRSIQPNLSVKVTIDTIFQDAKPVGVHVRRGDNLVSRMRSPTDAFLKAMRAYPDTTIFYVATDDVAEQTTFKAAFPGRILIGNDVFDRTSREGMLGAVTDFYALARCTEILGSAGSSFSEMAAAYGDCPLKIIVA